MWTRMVVKEKLFELQRWKSPTGMVFSMSVTCTLYEVWQKSNETSNTASNLATPQAIWQHRAVQKIGRIFISF